VLAQLTKHDAFTSLNKASDRYGHYLVNGTTRLWTKYRTGSGPTWRFLFSFDEVAHIWYDAEDHPDATVQVALVCGHETICLLSVAELWQVIDANEFDEGQAVTVSAPPGRSMRVKGPLGQLRRTVAHSAFPIRALSGE